MQPMLAESEPAWRSLLAGEEAERAHAAVDDIVADLASPATPAAAEAPFDHEKVRASVANGDAGLALFFAYLHRHRPGQGHDDRALAHLASAIEQIAASDRLADLYSGFTGVAWTVQHLAGRLIADDPDDDPVAEIDEVLVEHLGQSPWQREYDLTSGLAGYATYALSRLPRPAAVEALSRIVARFEELAEERADGLTWHTPSEKLWPEARGVFPEGNENLGVAHGVPGVIAVLAQIAAAGVEAERAMRLADGAVHWVLAQKLEEGQASLFPYAVGERVLPRFTRAAWCYGDPGIAAALMVAARAAGRADWEAEARAIALGAAQRPAETAGVRDACLCHGAAGLGHLFNRLWQATGDPALRDAAAAWLADALERRRPGSGVGGFLNWGPGTDGEMCWSADPAFLTGAAGIALALLAATGEVAPAWDRILLVSSSL